MNKQSTLLYQPFESTQSHIHIDTSGRIPPSPAPLCISAKDKSLICADIHIGKGSHFRKNGIAIPRLVNKNNFWNLAAAFELFEPDHFVVLGDMVHSSENEEWSDMSDFLDNYPAMSRTLIRGNHEIEHDRLYEKMGFDVSSSFRKDGFAFLHDEADRQEDDAFTFSGHIHPAVSLYGQGRQHLKVACFWLKPDGLVLPAFGTFTGSAAIRPKKSDRIFAVTDQTIIEIK